MTKHSLRIAVCAGVAPSKLGSLEDTILAIVARAHQRGHSCTVFCYSPLHEQFAEKLRQLNARWVSLDELDKRSFLAGVRRIGADFDVVFVTLLAFRARLLFQAYFAWPVRIILHDGCTPDLHPNRRNPLSIALDPLVFARTATVVAVSDFMRDRLTTIFRLNPSRTRTIYNGVDLSRFRKTEIETPVAGAVPTVLVVAHLVREKGLDILIDAMAKIDRKDARLMVVGSGPERTALIEQVAALGLTDRVEFLGVRDDVEQQLARCTVFVHPARWQEAFGYTVAEAMAAGRPVVASRTGALPELVAHQESGLLVEPDDPDALAAALNAILGSSELARRMGAEGRSRAERLFSLIDSADSLVSTFEEVVEEPPRFRLS